MRRQATLFYSELREFITSRGIEDAGPGFMRHLSIGRDGDLDMEFGYFTSRLHAGGGPVRSGQLPSGVYLTAEWTGPYENIDEVQAMLGGWARHNGVVIDAIDTEDGLTYGSRLQIFHVSPRFTDDPRQFRTEFAILTRPTEAAVAARQNQPGAGSAPSLAHFPMLDCLNE